MVRNEFSPAKKVFPDGKAHWDYSINSITPNLRECQEYATHDIDVFIIIDSFGFPDFEAPSDKLISAKHVLPEGKASSYNAISLITPGKVNPVF